MDAMPENNGWVKVYRKLMDSAVWLDDGLCKLWVYCLLTANHTRGWVPISGLKAPVEVQRGQFITGRFALHRALYPRHRKCEPSDKTVWRWLETLAAMQNVSIKTSNKFSIITIANYDNYQNTDKENVQVNVPEMSSRCPAGVQQVSTNKKNKKKEEGEEEEETDSPAVAGGGVSENSDSEKPPRKKPAGKPKADAPPVEPKPREKNPHWDAVCAIWGFNPVTKKDRRRIGDLTRDFKLKCEAAQAGPGEIEVRRDILAERFQGKDKATPDAVLKWWDSAVPDEIDPYAPVPAYEDAGGNWHIGYTPPSPEEEARILAEAKAEYDALPPEEQAFERMKYEAQMAWKAAGKPGNAPEAYMRWPKPKAGEAENG